VRERAGLVDEILDGDVEHGEGTVALTLLVKCACQRKEGFQCAGSLGQDVLEDLDGRYHIASVPRLAAAVKGLLESEHGWSLRSAHRAEAAVFEVLCGFETARLGQLHDSCLRSRRLAARSLSSALAGQSPFSRQGRGTPDSRLASG